MPQIKLPNGCYCSTPSVHPKNWNKPGASVREDWYIQYYFYDPSQTPGRKLRIVKGMNEFKTLEDRRFATRKILEDEMRLLTVDGYNPITGRFSGDTGGGDISQDMGLNAALQWAFDRLTCSSKPQIESALKYIKQSARRLGYDWMAVGNISRRHVSAILNGCEAVKKHWSAHLYNHYRAYLMMLFKILVQYEAVKYNPVDANLPKRKVEIKLRKLLIPDEREAVDQALMQFPAFRRFVHIFFHSGARPVELTRLKVEDVDLSRLVYRVTVYKGRQPRQEERPIKAIAAGWWEQQLIRAEPDWYVFGKLLEAGPMPCPRDYITKKWHAVVKEGIGINKDLYSLKHLNLDEISAALSLSDASRAAGHTSPVITMKHYAVSEKQRQADRIRGMGNGFV